MTRATNLTLNSASGGAFLEKIVEEAISVMEDTTLNVFQWNNNTRS